MKDHRFIELLNLYIDRQITAAETTELEAEIQESPGRQAVYRQYCQIHSATKQVYDSFRANATEQPAIQAGQTGAVELFESKRRKSHFAYYAGGLAAACLVLVFLRYNSTPTVGGDFAQAEVSMAAARPATEVVARIDTAKVADPIIGPVNLRTFTPDYSAMLAAMREQDEERAYANGHFQLNPARSLFDDGFFNSSTTAPTPDSRPFRIQQTPARQAEFTAFQFQR